MKITQNKAREWLLQYDLAKSGIYNPEQFIKSSLDMVVEICADKSYAEKANASLFGNRERLAAINRFLKSSNVFGCMLPGWFFVILTVAMAVMDYMTVESIVNYIWPTYTAIDVDPNMRRFRMAIVETMNYGWFYLEMLMIYGNFIFFVVAVINFFRFRKWERNVYWVVFQLVACFVWGLLCMHMISGIIENVRLLYFTYGGFGPTQYVDVKELYIQAEMPENIRTLYCKMSQKIDWIRWLRQQPEATKQFYGITEGLVVGALDSMTWRGHFSMVVTCVARTVMYVVGLRKSLMVVVPLGSPN